MEKFQHNNLIEITKTILFKIEHLIHLTKKWEKMIFLCV